MLDVIGGLSGKSAVGSSLWNLLNVFFAVLYVAEVDTLLFFQEDVSSKRNQTHLGV